MAFHPPSSPQPTPTHIPQAHMPDLGARTPGETLGTFTAMLRRPKATRQGLIAQFYGETGPDADIIAAFHLAHFLDTVVHLRIWVIKASSGKEMKDAQGNYLELPSFTATIKRPSSTNDGLVAQFFAANGEHSDRANELNKSAYLDSLVLVQVIAGDENEQFVPRAGDVAPLEDLAEAAKRMTPTEERLLKKQQKRAQEAWRQLLQSGFFRKHEVWTQLGGETAYCTWLRREACCHPGDQPCPNLPSEPFRVANPDLAMPYVPLCGPHTQAWEAGLVQLPSGTKPMSFLITEHERHIVRWAQLSLRDALATPAGYDPSPARVYTWIVDHKLRLFMPNGFEAFLNP